MALLLAPRALRRLPGLVQTSARHTHKRGGADAGGAGAGGAGGAEGGECRPHPCCAPPPPRTVDKHIKCLQPLTGSPPPCATPPLPPSRTCKDAIKKDKKKKVEHIEAADECGARLYSARQRLADAARVRRLDYEREAAECEKPPPADYSTYCLAAETATDIPDTCPTEDRSMNCEITGDKHVDLCAHLPHTYIKVDRSGGARKSSQDVCAEPDLQPVQPKAQDGLTTRIMEKFKRRKVSEAATSPGSGPKPVRPCPKSGNTGCTKRGLHTIASCSAIRESELIIQKYNLNWLKQSLHDCINPKDPSLIVGTDFQKDRKCNAFLDLLVPHYTDSATDRYYNFYFINEATSPTSLCSRERGDSWLSLSNIWRKISNLWKKDERPKTPASKNNPKLCSTKPTHAHTPSEPKHAKKTVQSDKRCGPKVKCCPSDSCVID